MSGLYPAWAIGNTVIHQTWKALSCHSGIHPHIVRHSRPGDGRQNHVLKEEKGSSMRRLPSIQQNRPKAGEVACKIP
jgi:hypothetical protein